MPLHEVHQLTAALGADIHPCLRGRRNPIDENLALLAIIAFQVVRGPMRQLAHFLALKIVFVNLPDSSIEVVAVEEETLAILRPGQGARIRRGRRKARLLESTRIEQYDPAGVPRQALGLRRRLAGSNQAGHVFHVGHTRSIGFSGSTGQIRHQIRSFSGI